MRPPVLRARLLGPMDLTFGERQFPPLDSARAEDLPPGPGTARLRPSQPVVEPVLA
jgi:hypothetical protein